MQKTTLNLARVWRTRSFDTIIGQELSVKMLKNSLYRNYLFPVYLFWGQRGTGKTSTARIVAAAINCQQLELFQKDPKNYPVPCQQCNSCNAVALGNHPDFIEIDAASHTGVDNIRHVIDSATFMPIMGRKKIYLIDEAHMLSKAAFNALLKILEDPPASALFMLATTDHQKIIDTVRSRCFQIVFKPVNHIILTKYLESICKEEGIMADVDALSLIARESEGSVRDAINLLEQVRFAQGRINATTILALLGHVDDATLLGILAIIITGNHTELLTYLQEQKLSHYAPEYVWQRLVTLIHAMAWAYYGIKTPTINIPINELSLLAKKATIKRITTMLHTLYEHEQLLHKTVHKGPLIDLVLLEMCQADRNNTEPITQSQAEKPSNTLNSTNTTTTYASTWQQFVVSMQESEPLLYSIFGQGVCQEYNAESGNLTITFAQQFSFFHDMITSTAAQWQNRLNAIFGKTITLNVQFNGAGNPVLTLNNNIAREASPAKSTPSISSKGQIKKKQAPIDVTDRSKWPSASLIVQHFPGTVYEE